MARRIALGSVAGGHNLRRVVIGFDDDVFTEIQGRAERERTSFAEQVRLLTEWGLEADNAAD